MRVLSLIVILSVTNTSVGQLPGRFVDSRKVFDLDAELESPGISPDGLTLYFMSPVGGFGEEDLYYATRETLDDTFSNPINLGAGVNTAGIENKPFVTANGLTLYFHSDRDGGEGGIDLYFATRSNTTEEFGNATNLGPEVNSPQTDAGPYLSSDGSELYLHSDRSGVVGARSIYRATREQPNSQFSGVMQIESNINSEGWDGDVSLSTDGLTMFFNSTRPSTQLGDLGLYVAQRPSLDAEWGDAIDLNDFGLGSELNLPSSTTFQPEISSDWPAAGSRLYYMSATSANDFEVFEATWEPVPEPSTAVLTLVATLMLSCRRRARLW